MTDLAQIQSQPQDVKGKAYSYVPSPYIHPTTYPDRQAIASQNLYDSFENADYVPNEQQESKKRFPLKYKALIFVGTLIGIGVACKNGLLGKKIQNALNGIK